MDTSGQIKYKTRVRHTNLFATGAGRLVTTLREALELQEPSEAPTGAGFGVVRKRRDADGDHWDLGLSEERMRWLVG